MAKRRKAEEDQGLRKTLVRRLELARTIHDLTKRQGGAIQSEDWDGLKAVLDEKDQRICEFQETERFLPESSRLEREGGRTPSVGTMLSRIESTLVAVQSLETKQRQSLTDKKKQMARTLHRIRMAREGITRFKRSRVGVPRFIDLRK